MSDLLEKMIRENKEAFETDAPEGHAERFEARLNQQFGKAKRPAWKPYLQAAAAILLIWLAGNQAYHYFSQPPHEQPASLASVSPEYAEVEFYYTSAINQGMHEWEKLSRNGYLTDEDQQLMQNEMDEFDRTYTRLQQELAANPEDERVINAMLELYQTKLSIITLIIQKLEEIKQQKNNHHETEI